MFLIEVSPQAAEDLAKDPDVGIPLVKVIRIMYSRRDFVRILFDE